MSVCMCKSHNYSSNYHKIWFTGRSSKKTNQVPMCTMWISKEPSDFPSIFFRPHKGRNFYQIITIHGIQIRVVKL